MTLNGVPTADLCRDWEIYGPGEQAPEPAHTTHKLPNRGAHGPHQG